MKAPKHTFSQKQLTFQELFIGTLIYAVVLGFLNDYTAFVEANSFSTIFFASAVLSILTYLTFALKKRIVAWLKNHHGAFFRVLTFLSVWLIMFLSKFVFVWALDLVFGSYISINGFFGILIVVVLVTVVQRLAYLIFKRLGPSNS